jgi:inner membrane protein
MEPVTHFLTGAVLSRAGFNRRTAYATLAMTLAAEAPDLDVLWAIRGPVASFQHHRGITHTFLRRPRRHRNRLPLAPLPHSKNAGAPGSRS